MGGFFRLNHIPERQPTMSNEELTANLLERWQADAEAAANPPDRAEVAKTFGDFLSAQLDSTPEQNFAGFISRLPNNDEQEN
jgi:hypothetical protein